MTRERFYINYCILYTSFSHSKLGEDGTLAEVRLTFFGVVGTVSILAARAEDFMMLVNDWKCSWYPSWTTSS